MKPARSNVAARAAAIAVAPNRRIEMADPTPNQAAARLTEIDTALRAAPTTDLQGGDAAQRAALVAEKIRLYPIANPPTTPTSTGRSWREQRQHRLEAAEMR